MRTLLSIWFLRYIASMGYYLVRFVFFLTSLFPQIVRIGFGSLLGRLVFKCLPKRQHIIARNLALCFPDISDDARKHMALDVQASMGIGLFEASFAWFASDRRVRKLVSLSGFEHLRDAVTVGDGVIVILPHFTHMVLALRILVMCAPIHLVYRDQGGSLLQNMIMCAQNAHNCTGLKQGDMRAVLRVLSRGGIVCILSDHDMGPQHSVFAPFFNVNSATVCSVSKLAQLTGSPVVPFSLYRNKENTYVAEILAPLKSFPSQNVVQDAARMNAVFEACIRQAAEQYYWCHRRFKTCPENEESRY